MPEHGGASERATVHSESIQCAFLLQRGGRAFGLGLGKGRTDGEITTHQVFYLCCPGGGGVSHSQAGCFFTTLVSWCIV